jgi:hypothetical protein
MSWLYKFNNIVLDALDAEVRPPAGGATDAQPHEKHAAKSGKIRQEKVATTL